MSGARDHLRGRYDQLWSEAIGRIRAGRIERDPVLQAGLPDPRRGFTVIARPSPAVRQRLAAVLRDLRQIEQEQYYYSPSEFHVTVLSLFTATLNPNPWLAQKSHFIAAVDAALKRVAPIRIDFKGVTASRGAVLVQGFPDNESLNGLRDLLRSQLKLHGLGEGVDQRYRLRTAHMTVVRFRSPLSDSRRFAAALEEARQKAFGMTTVRSLSLVENDWYMSHRATRILKSYRLVPAQ